MKCEKLNSIFCLNKKKRKNINPSPSSDSILGEDYDDNVVNRENMNVSPSYGSQKTNYELLNSYVDGCFMPIWDHVVEYNPKTKYRCLNEIVKVEDLWEDPSGVMELNSRQKKRFFCWIRYFNLCENLHFFKAPPSSDRILQGYVGDCSTVSSLSSLSEYEKLNGSVLSDKIKLIDLQKTVENLSKLSYPEGSIEYLKRYKLAIGVKIYFNGCARCMFVDDWIPIRKDNTLLCAHSSDPGELWVTLFEKANVRLFGKTYSIKGTNPGIDIYHLTGWIPEIIQLPPYRYKIPNEGLVKEYSYNGKTANEREDITNVNKWNIIWNNILHSYNGNFVVCLGTNDLYDVTTNENYIEGISVSSGIVSGHAYSVLDVLEVELEGDYHKLLLLKNPWGKISSKIKLDPKIVSVLPYCKPSSNEDDDNGVFWIEWISVLKWFSHLYLCWNNEKFEFTNKIHFKWTKNAHFINSPVPEDSYLSLYNPQIYMTSQVGNQGVDKEGIEATHGTTGKNKGVNKDVRVYEEDDEFVIYVILIQNKKTLKDKMKYLALHTFEGSSRLITPNNPAINGVYNNSEVILCKLLLASKNGNKQDNLLKYGKYNLIETMNDPIELVLLICHFMKKIDSENSFTMMTFSNKQLKLELLPLMTDRFNNFIYEYKWSKYNNGMNPNELWSFFSNPHFRLEVKEDVNMILMLETDREVSVNLRLFFGRIATVRALRTKQAISSKEYKLYCCAIQGCFKKGIYTLIPSNFNGIEANFRFNIFHDGSSNENIKVCPIPYPYVKLGDVIAKNVRTAGDAGGLEIRGKQYGGEAGDGKYGLNVVDKEYKIDLSNSKQTLNGDLVLNDDELLDNTVRYYELLDCHKITVTRMVNEYYEFKVDRPTVAAIRIKVNSVSDNKFVLFSKGCKNYVVNPPNSSRCLNVTCENKNVVHGRKNDYMDLDGRARRCEDIKTCLTFCSDVCCIECGGPCGQFYPTDPSLFHTEYKLGFEHCVFSDLNGGLSKNGRTPSNSSQVVFLKENVVNFSLVNLFPNVQYRLLSVNHYRFQTLVFIADNRIVSM